MDVVFILVFVLVFLCSFLVLTKPKGLPPGPLTLPVVGSYFFLKELRKKRAHLSFFDASKIYGKIYSFRIGFQLIVVLHGYDAIHQALVKQSDVFSDRPNFLPAFQRVLAETGRGIIFQGYNHQWKTLRRFTLQTLRDFGVGKSSIEEKIAYEINAATKVLECSAGKPFEISPVLQKVIGNVIYGIVFGKRFDFDDPDFDIIRRMSNIAVSGQGATSVSNFFPLWVSWIFARKSHNEAVFRRKNFDNIRAFIDEQIKQHEESYDENNIRDFVDLYIQVSRDSKEETAEVFTKGSMLRVILELFIAGAETTYNTLDWAFLFMSENPDIQAKCVQEIKDTVGDKSIQYSDRISLTYVEATISEVQRHANVAPLAVQHCASEDTTLMGYHIPKRTIIMPSLYSANMDPNYWKDPYQFRPERLIDSKGKLIKNEALIPFSTGPRVCLGEPLARMELFLVFANMLQRFEFERENANVKHSMDLKPNQVTSAPYPYKLRANKRSE